MPPSHLKSNRLLLSVHGLASVRSSDGSNPQHSERLLPHGGTYLVEFSKSPDTPPCGAGSSTRPFHVMSTILPLVVKLIAMFSRELGVETCFHPRNHDVNFSRLEGNIFKYAYPAPSYFYHETSSAPMNVCSLVRLK